MMPILSNNIMVNYFVVTSAVKARHNLIPTELRLQQTLDSAVSVKKYCKDAKVLLIEVGPEPLTESEQEQLIAKFDGMLLLNHEPLLRKFYEIGSGSDFWVKTPGELYGMCRFLENQNFVSAHDRVFKLSGRYQLTADFDARRHDQPGKLVVLDKKPAVVYINTSGDPVPQISEYQYNTWLYSFCGSLIDVMAQRYQLMLDKVLERYGRIEFVDAEHMLYAICHDLVPLEISPMGVMGQQAINAEWIIE